MIEHADEIKPTGELKAIYWKQFWSRNWTQSHLVKVIQGGYDVADRALCGKDVDHTSYREDESGATCKACLKAARKAGL